jgi:hypothetical protein
MFPIIFKDQKDQNAKISQYGRSSWQVSSRKGPDGAPYRPMASRLLAGRRAGALAALLIHIANLL